MKIGPRLAPILTGFLLTACSAAEGSRTDALKVFMGVDDSKATQSATSDGKPVKERLGDFSRTFMGVDKDAAAAQKASDETPDDWNWAQKFMGVDREN